MLKMGMLELAAVFQVQIHALLSEVIQKELALKNEMTETQWLMMAVQTTELSKLDGLEQVVLIPTLIYVIQFVEIAKRSLDPKIEMMEISQMMMDALQHV